MARCPYCSRNAHAQKVLAWDNSASQRARGRAGENVGRNRGSTRLPLKMKWGNWKTLAVEDQLVSTPEEKMSELGRIIYNLARRPQSVQHGCHSTKEWN